MILVFRQKINFNDFSIFFCNHRQNTLTLTKYDAANAYWKTDSNVVKKIESFKQYKMWTQKLKMHSPSSKLSNGLLLFNIPIAIVPMRNVHIPVAMKIQKRYTKNILSAFS